MMHPELPRLSTQGSSARLQLRGGPYLVIGGECYNSSGSTSETLAVIWKHATSLNLNTVLVPVYWELIEPEEGRFDFSSVDLLINQARENQLRLIPLWFGTWKNAQSTYVPAWAKLDTKRFFRVEAVPGEKSRTISPLCSSAAQADARAFTALMRHIRQVDSAEQTVVMVQVENETGLLGAARDVSSIANKAFEQQVPPSLIAKVSDVGDEGSSEFRQAWQAAGSRSGGNWHEIFGATADEIFMAWHIALFVETVVAAGKREYALPMFVNCWLVQHDAEKPGSYPSGGPVSKVMEVWRAAAPSIDFYSPDIYLNDFKGVCAKYALPDNPLFIPESKILTAYAEAFWAIGEHGAIGFSPYNFDAFGEAPLLGEARRNLAETNQLLDALAEFILANVGTGKLRGILQTQQLREIVDFGHFRALISFNERRTAEQPIGRGLLIQLADNEFLIAGADFHLSLLPAVGQRGTTDFLHAREVHVDKRMLSTIRHLNGDDTWGAGIGMGSTLRVIHAAVYNY